MFATPRGALVRLSHLKHVHLDVRLGVNFTPLPLQDSDLGDSVLDEADLNHKLWCWEVRTQQNDCKQLKLVIAAMSLLSEAPLDETEQIFDLSDAQQPVNSQIRKVRTQVDGSATEREPNNTSLTRGRNTTGMIIRRRHEDSHSGYRPQRPGIYSRVAEVIVPNELTP